MVALSSTYDSVYPHTDEEITSLSLNEEQKPNYLSFHSFQQMHNDKSSEGRESLSGEYEDFNHSTSALKLCLLHMAIYFSLSVIVFSFLVEKWPIVDSIYFATLVFTTVGYGDHVPTSDIGRLITVCWALYGK